MLRHFFAFRQHPYKNCASWRMIVRRFRPKGKAQHNPLSEHGNLIQA